ncbi:unnamed protein product [Effrenium voratum]|uniref:Uncharacterized protein n=1 Tax=Effrenium voratum TaxID=2562239 RepID=A0AA36JQV1_9DINO|nr:unnamed protein product [Effrenium voratum]CAJ1433014.1 unnamed protein product [Effrenium voratum]
MKVEKMKEEKVAEQVLEYPIKTELCQPGQDSIQPVKRRRLRRHDTQVGRNVADASGKIHTKKDVLDWHSFWLKVKHELKEQVRSMDDESLKRGGFTKEEDAGVCKVETGTAVKAEHAESSHQAGSAAIAPTSSSGAAEIGLRAGESTTSTTRLEEQKVEPGSPPDASTGVVKVEPSSEPTDSRSADGKLAAAEFEEQVALWARQCAGFRKRATWMPTRPCCPANVFFSNPVARQEEDPPCVQRLSRKELSCLRLFFERGHPLFSASLRTGPATKVPTPTVSGAAAAATQQEVGLPASSSASMKMWPWMRDLPSNIWAGRGWVYDEQSGARRLSSAGGADAMKGVQVWESIGTAEQPAAALEQPRPVNGAAPGQSASLVPAAPNYSVKPVKVLAKQQAKQSGVPGISWHSSSFRWQLQWTEKGQTGGEAARHIQNFSASSFMKDGLNEAEAEAAALEAAKAFRARLVAKGRIKEKRRGESLTSNVPGVAFKKAKKKWNVEISRPGGRRIQGGCFTEKAEAEGRALELRELHGLQRSVKASASRDELPVFQPKAPSPGVSWERQAQCWHAQLTRNKRKKDSRFRPLDHSEAELEKAFAKAVAWLKKERKEMAS